MYFRRVVVSCLLLLQLPFASCRTVQAPLESDSSALTSQLQELAQARLDANVANDRGYYEHLLAENFRILYPNGQVKTKKEYLDGEHFGPQSAGKRGSKATITDFRVVLDGEIALATYNLVEHLPLGPQQFDHPMTRLDIYVRRGSEWKLLSMAVTDRPSWPDASKISTRLLTEYAGTYDQGGDLKIVVTNEAGRLMAQMTGQEKTELIPENDTTFFDKTDENPNARSVFERDSSGKVASLVYRAYGQKIRAAKINK